VEAHPGRGEGPYRKPHALRHAFASILLSRGANLLYVTKAGGWSNATTLLKVYSKWIEEAPDASSVASSDLTPRNLTPAELAV
jgi:integrase